MRQKGAKGQRIAAIAAGQYGAISTQQLRAAGLSQSGISRRVAEGQLHRVHQGVYAVGHVPLSAEEKWMAAVIACRRDVTAGAKSTATILERWGAALSHGSAASLWQLLPLRSGPIDVSVPGGGAKKRRRGIRVHRCLSLLPSAVTLHRGIPVTTPARTISDLRLMVRAKGRLGTFSEKELRRATREADVIGLPIGDEVERDRSRSDLERDFLRLCRRRRLPRPEVNIMIGRDLVDFLWRDRRLVVETDGYRYHRGRVAFEDDRERDLRLRALGFDVVRVSEKQVNESPGAVAEAVVAALRVGADARKREDQVESGESER